MASAAEKICTKCHEEKPPAAFYKKSGGKDGLQAQCKTCAKAYKVAAGKAAYSAKNPEKIAAKAATYHAENRLPIVLHEDGYPRWNGPSMKPVTRREGEGIHPYEGLPVDRYWAPLPSRVYGSRQRGPK